MEGPKSSPGGFEQLPRSFGSHSAPIFIDSYLQIFRSGKLGQYPLTSDLQPLAVIPFPVLV